MVGPGRGGSGVCCGVGLRRRLHGPLVSPSTTPSQVPTTEGYGPLTLVDAPGGGPLVRGGTGPIHIEGDCVTVTVENGDVLLLIWQSANVRWDDENEAIIFTSLDQDAESIAIRDGDEIELGGALLDDLPVETQLDWLATPHPICSGEAWFVSGITRQ